MIAIGYEEQKRLGVSYVLGLLSPLTPYGAERVRRLRFYAPTERAALEMEWDNVQAAADGLAAHPEAYARLGRLLMQVRDIRGTLRNCRDMALSEVELFEVKRFLLQLSLIAPLFEEIKRGYQGIAFTEEKAALALLDPDGSRSAGFAVGGPGAKALEAVREAKRQVERALRGAPEGKAREDLLAERRELAAREEDEALQVRAGLSKALRPHVDALLLNTEMIGRLDFTIQRAELARSRGACRPRVGSALRLEQMEHPEVADGLKERGQIFTRVTLEAPRGVTVVTGANMGGKSVALRALTLNVLLCHAGFFALAREAALPLFDAVEAVSGDLSDAGAGLSSFGAEVLRIQGILERAAGGAFCFIALDEPARGTNPREGGALVRALVKRLADMDAVSVIATHYDGAARGAHAHYQAAGLRGLPDGAPGEDRLAFIARHMNYGLVKVDNEAETPREALAICRLLGLDGAVLEEMERELSREG